MILYVCVRACLWMCVYIHMYLCMYDINTHTHTHIHIHTILFLFFYIVARRLPEDGIHFCVLFCFFSKLTYVARGPPAGSTRASRG